MSLESIDPAVVPAEVTALAARIARHGGRALVVGGWVRDQLRGAPSVDLDLEVHGLTGDVLGAVLEEVGPVHEIGRAFKIRRVRGLDADISCVEPRAGSGSVSDAYEFAIAYDEASRRRDLTINAMGFDPLSCELLDPADGRGDLEARRLRSVDETRFGDDPLRALRVAQLAARLEMEPDAALLALCARQQLSGMAGERLMNEWTRLLTLAARPSLALEWLERMDQLRAFPEIEALRGVPQDARWHPEGDVFIHTKMTLDAAALLRTASDEPVSLMFGALCHDFGKPSTTRVEPSNEAAGADASPRIRSIDHERAGLPPTRAFLERMQASKRLVAQVEALVDRHLAPIQFVNQNAGDKAYRRLVRKLDRAGLLARHLADVARADHLGRTTEDARLGRFPEGDAFLRRIAELGLENGPRTAAVQGRHLVALGHAPGPEFGEILERCLAMQDATGSEDVDDLLTRVLGSQANKGSRKPSDDRRG